MGFNHMQQKSKLHSSSHCDYDYEVVCGYVDGLTIGCMGSQAMYYVIIMMMIMIF